MPIQKKKCAKILVLDMKLNKLYHFPPALAIQNEKIRANARSRHKSSLSALLPAPEHFAHVHRRLPKRPASHMRMDGPLFCPDFVYGFRLERIIRTGCRPGSYHSIRLIDSPDRNENTIGSTIKQRHSL